MRTTPFRTALLLLQFSMVAAQSAPIQNLTFTEVIKDVFVIDPATKKETPAKTGEKLVPPNVLKTGADSRAELVAEDKTVTRVGSNTIFSVEANSRDVNLTQGSVLFHSPAGRGGGRIKSAGATASVLGTTLAVSANSDGGFKTSLLEGKGEVKDPKGGKVGLVAGQVTFAKPGGGLSPALNFDLKAQISSSKLVGGFSAQLASIGKIQAAVSVQQAKIAGGALASTDMLIGDRPDTAFKVDAAIVDGQIRQAQTRRILQEAAEQETRTFYEVDPRYLKTVVQRVQVSLEGTLADPTLTLPASNVFIIDRTGRASMEPETPNAIGGVPRNLPGNRQDSSVTYSAFIAEEISLASTWKLENAQIETSLQTQQTSLTLGENKQLPAWLTPGMVLTGEGILPGTTVTGVEDRTATLNQPASHTFKGGILSAEDLTDSQPFLTLPLLETSGAALVARQNLNFTGAIDFVGVDKIETTPDGYEVGQTLLLSAGKTITITPGSKLVANTSLFEIYTGGSSFAASLSLALTPLKANEAPVALTLDRVALINDFPLDPSSNSNGIIRITAPEIRLTDTLIHAGSKSSEIAIESSGPVSVLTASGLPGDDAYAKATSKLLLSLGLDTPKELCIEAFKVGIRSDSKTVAINGVNILANEITLRGGDQLHLSAVLIDKFDHERKQSFTASALNDVTIQAGEIGGQAPLQIIAATSTSRIYSDNADVTIRNIEFGPEPIPSLGTEPETTFTVKALRGAILLDSSVINADRVFINPLEQDPLKPEVVLFDGKSVTLQGVTIAPTHSDTGSIEVSSASDLTVEKGSTASVPRFTAYKITLDAKNKMTLTDLTVEHGSDSNPTEFKATAGTELVIDNLTIKKAALFDAKAVEKIDIANTSLDSARTVSIGAQTLVLSNVHFREDAHVTLTSGDGVLSTPLNRSDITPGWVNVLPKVTYGTYDLHKLSEQMGVHGTSVSTNLDKKPSQGIPFEKFGAAVEAQFKVKLPNLTIAKKK